jgi:hypothetical protein
MILKPDWNHIQRWTQVQDMWVSPFQQVGYADL